MYISPVDILGISVDELMNLDNKGLIRLEKKLNIQKLQNKGGHYNPQQFDSLLVQLTDTDKKLSIFFIEKHPNLKHFITTGKDVGIKTFTIDESLLSQAPHIREFLAPYFDAYFMRLVKQDYKAKKYDTILSAMQHKELFTDQLLAEYYDYIKGQVEVVVERILVARKGQLASNTPQITYKTFVALMNTLPLGYIRKAKFAYVNALVDYYNLTLNKHGEFSKIQLAFRNFTLIEIGDEDSIAQFKRLAKQIGNTAVLHQNAKESSSSSIWGTVIIVFTIIVFIGRSARVFKGSSDYSSTNNISNDYPSFNFPDSGDKTAFYSDIIHKAQGDSIVNGVTTQFSTGQNYFPLQFRKITTNAHSDQRIIVANSRTHQLLLFVQEDAKNDVNKTIAIAANDSLSILGISKKSRLMFYAGTDFVTVKNNKSFVENNGNYKIYPTKRYFKTVSETELGWLKDIYIIDSIGKNPKIKLGENELLLSDIFFHTKPHIMLPPEIEEIVEETVIEATVYDETKDAWSSPKNEFFSALAKGKVLDEDNIVLGNGDNPYSNTFKKSNHISISGYKVKVYNDCDEDLIVFSRNLSSQRDQAVFVTSFGNVEIHLHKENDTLYFYKGKKFNKEKSNNINHKTTPDGYFSEVTNYGQRLLKKAFIVQDLGSEPNIQVTDSDILINQIRYKEE